MKQLLIAIFVTVLSALGVEGQTLKPITWTFSVEDNSVSAATLKFNASITKGWHLYGLDLHEDGPNATAFNFTLPEGVELDGAIEPSRQPIVQYDDMFMLELSWWDANVSFTQKLKITDGMVHEVSGTVFFQGCNDQSCLSPQKIPFSLKVGEASAAASVAQETPQIDSTPKKVSSFQSTSTTGWWAKPDVPQATDRQTQGSVSSPWWLIFVWGFGGGLLALLTPCVWPLIPMTVSFFLKKSGSRRKQVGDAIIYGISIVVIYLSLGLVITGIFGASKLNELSTNAVFNLVFFIILLLFAISFFGGFDIQLPERWRNGADSRAERATGLLSIFFMAFTLALVSFSCTGPIIGTLLVEAATMGNLVGPAVGMTGFALALALPFTVFAVFPSWLKEVPRSGNWMNSVKVVLGFLELALSLKFLSVADLAYGWGILDREVFVSLWVVIFTLLGLYLLGKIRFAHDAPLQHVSISRFFLALSSFAFSVYLLPGMWGAPLKGVSAFVPPLYTQDFSLYAGGTFEEFDDYDEGMKYAAANHRPVLIDFSGYGCVNCRKMEGAVFDTQEVSKIVKENFVLIKLMVDDKKLLPEPLTVEENGNRVVIETIGEKWSYLQRWKFGANSQPYYIILDNEGSPLVPAAFYDENVTKFVEWLNAGMANYQKISSN